MGVFDYDIPWQAEMHNVSLIKKVLLFIGLILFLVIASAAFNVMNNSGIGIRACTMEAESEPLYDYNMPVLTRNTAEQMISRQVARLNFVGTSLEPCGTAFIFEDINKTKYSVCERGAIYKYNKVCRTLVRGKSGFLIVIRAPGV